MKKTEKSIESKKENSNKLLKNLFDLESNINKLKKLKESLILSKNKNKKSVFAQRFLTEITPEENVIKNNKKVSFNKNIQINNSIFTEKNKKEFIPKIKLFKRYFSQVHINNKPMKKLKLKKSITEANFNFTTQNFNEKKNKSQSNIKIKKIKINNSYEKCCNNINHLHKKKLISCFLTPMNNFIKNDFKLLYEDYEKINNKIILNYSNINLIKKKYLIPKLPKIPFNYQKNPSNFKYKL